MAESYFRDIFYHKRADTGTNESYENSVTYTDNSNEKIETNKEEGVNYEKEEEYRVRVVVVVETKM